MAFVQSQVAGDEVSWLSIKRSIDLEILWLLSDYLLFNIEGQIGGQIIVLYAAAPIVLHLIVKWPWTALQVLGINISLHISINILQHFSSDAKNISIPSLPVIERQTLCLWIKFSIQFPRRCNTSELDFKFPYIHHTTQTWIGFKFSETENWLLKLSRQRCQWGWWWKWCWNLNWGGKKTLQKIL